MSKRATFVTITPEIYPIDLFEMADQSYKWNIAMDGSFCDYTSSFGIAKIILHI